MIRTKVQLVVTRDKSKQFAALDVLTKRSVYVGFPESTDVRKKDVMRSIGKKKRKRMSKPDTSGVTNAMIAYVQDNGSPLQGIPKREFMRPGIMDAQENIADILAKGGEAALEGDSAGVERQLNKAGLVSVSAVRNKIQVGPFQPLAPRTLKGRRARGRTGTRPLVDTGQMRNAVTYVVRNTKK